LLFKSGAQLYSRHKKSLQGGSIFSPNCAEYSSIFSSYKTFNNWINIVLKKGKNFKSFQKLSFVLTFFLAVFIFEIGSRGKSRRGSESEKSDESKTNLFRAGA